MGVIKEISPSGKLKEREKRRRSGHALLSLSAAAMALPAFAVNQPTETELAVKSSYYEEDPIRGSDEVVIVGDPDRYTIKVNQFYLVKLIYLLI